MCNMLVYDVYPLLEHFV